MVPGRLSTFACITRYFPICRAPTEMLSSVIDGVVNVSTSPSRCITESFDALKVSDLKFIPEVFR